MAQLTPAMKRILLAREKVARRNVFFASIIYAARLIETQETPYGMKTMFTNGLDIFFHPEFVEQNDACIEGVLLHEVLHCALNHVPRREGRHPALFNMACDYAINPMITSIYKLPQGALIDSKFDGLSAEMIYDQLYKSAKKVKVSGGGDPGEGGEKSGRMLDPTPEQMEQAEEEWRRVVQMAKEKAEKAGQLHGQLRRLIEELFPSEKIDWKLLLDDMIRDAREIDNACWHRPNRRFLGEGDIFPGHTQNKILRLVACIDSSGSISEEYLKEMKAELMSLLDQQMISSVVLISTDTTVCNQEEVDNSEGVKNFDLGMHGGGTQFDAAMKEVAKIEDAAGVIFLTDMMTGSFGKDPGIPVIWIDWTNTGTQKVPFGMVVPYNR